MTLVGKLFNRTPNHIPRNTLEEDYGLPIISRPNFLKVQSSKIYNYKQY